MKLMEEHDFNAKKKMKKKGNVRYLPQFYRFRASLFYQISFSFHPFLPKDAANLLADDRFKVMFENPDFQVDSQSEEFRLLNPIISKVGEKRRQRLAKFVQQEEQVQNREIARIRNWHEFVLKLSCFEMIFPNSSLQQDEEDEEVEGRGSSEEDESSDDDKSWVEEVREQRRLLRMEARERRIQERKESRQQDRNTSLVTSDPSGNPQQDPQNQPRFYQIKAGEEFRSFSDVTRKQKMLKYVTA